MTVHAAKGLEFPVVFLVNLARGTGNRRDPIRVAADPDGDVAVGRGRRLPVRRRRGRCRARARGNEAAAVRGADARARPAVSRLGAEGRPGPARTRQPGGGAARIAARAAARAARRPVEWRASSGAVHALRVCARARWQPAPGRDGVRPLAMRRRCAGDDFAPLDDTAPPRRPIAAHRRTSRRRDGPAPAAASRIGSSARWCIASCSALGARRRAGRPALLRDGWRSLAAAATRSGGARLDRQPSLDAALAAYRALCGARRRARAVSLGRRLHEVPFTMRSTGDWCAARSIASCATATERVTRARVQDRPAAGPSTQAQVGALPKRAGCFRRRRSYARTSRRRCDAPIARHIRVGVRPTRRTCRFCGNPLLSHNGSFAIITESKWWQCTGG